MTAEQALWWGLVVALVVAMLGWWTAHTRVRRHNQRRQRIAGAGEAAALEVVRDAGYEVVDAQVTVEFALWVDGEEVWVRNRADLILRRDGRVYVADVKTGARACDPTHPATRRQLLEYLLCHEADGALVIDMERREVIEVAFPGLLGDGEG